MGSGATFKELSGSKLATVEIPLPSLEVQKEIVTRLDDIFLKVKIAMNSYEQKKNELQLLRQSIIKQAFNGELVKE